MAGMRVYRALCRVFPHSYRAKLMAVVLGCTLLPLLGFALWLMHSNGVSPEHLLTGVLVAVSVTLIGAAGFMSIVAPYFSHRASRRS